MKKTFWAIFALSIAGISCKKSSSAPETSLQYIDFSPGTARKYQSTNNLTATTTVYTLTSTNRDSTINSKVYHVFTNSSGTPNEYYNITGSDYYTFRNLGAASGNLTVESIYLKVNAAVGISWNQVINITVPGLPGTVPATLTNTIAETGISRTVNSINYSNVIRVTTTISVQGVPASAITTDIQSYYAPVTGLIESKNKISAPALTVNVDQSTLLLQ